MKSSVQKKKKPKQNQEVKAILCDIVKKCNAFVETDKKLEELVVFCSGSRTKPDIQR